MWRILDFLLYLLILGDLYVLGDMVVINVVGVINGQVLIDLVVHRDPVNPNIILMLMVSFLIRV